MKKDLLSMQDLSCQDLAILMDEAHEIKRMKSTGEPHEFLRGRSLAMIFEKASTRTRISFEVGMYELGGYPLFLNPKDMQLGRGEEIRDTARVLSRYVSAVMIRANQHATLEEFARHSSIPVINGLSDREHPCQLLADIMTLEEFFGSTEGLKVAWVGDGNNVCHSLILSSALTGMEVAVASPQEYRPDQGVVDLARETGGRVTLTESAGEAASGADAIYTDVWVSMGDEAEREARLRAFRGFTVDEELVSHAKPEAIVMHCLPAHRGEEISDVVIEGEQSVVWQQAENRLHAEKALLLEMLRPR
jgi:ornithine carbamoyltransferase